MFTVNYTKLKNKTNQKDGKHTSSTKKNNKTQINRTTNTFRVFYS